MQNGNSSNRLWAYALIAFGALALAANMGWFGAVSSWLWAILFIAGGAAFVLHYLNNRERWWALIPGAALTFSGVTMLLGSAGGPLFMALLGLGFLALFLTKRERWWAVIPGGVLLTLAIVDWVELATPGADQGWLFFLGIAATFGFLYLRPDGGPSQRWAVWPAVAGLGLALLSFVSTSVGSVLAPVALIGLGIYLFMRNPGRAEKSPRQEGDRP